MEIAERQHAKKMEQIMASIDKKLERIAKSLEKMEPTLIKYDPSIYKLPLYDIQEFVDTLKESSANQYLATTAEEERPSEIGPVYPGRDPASATENASKVNTPNYWRDCLSDTFKP